MKEIFIPLIDHRTDQDVCDRYYRRAIYNTLLELKPKHCLEIGTYLFQTSAVFSRYFQENNKEGVLITADISVWDRKENPPNVYPIMFYPYVENPSLEHKGIKIFKSDYKEIFKSDLSLESNIYILMAAMQDHNIKKFDLTFVDGDHTRISFLNDLYIAKLVTKKEGYILIDDIKDKRHDQFHVYNELKRKNNFYEYENFNPNPGLAIIQNRNFIYDHM